MIFQAMGVVVLIFTFIYLIKSIFEFFVDVYTYISEKIKAKESNVNDC